MKKFLSVIIALTIVLAMMPVAVFAATDISGATISTIASQEYTGNAITPTPTVKVNGNTLTEGVDFTYSYENNVNVGTTATVIITGMGNYTGTASKTFRISQASFTFSVSIAGWTEGETASTPTVSGNKSGGTVTFEYKVKTASNSTYTDTVPTTAGEYTVRASIAATTNYRKATATATFTIGAPKAAQTITAADVTATFGDTGKAVSASTNGNGAITYAVSAGTDVVDVNATTGALTIKNAGTATITVSAAATDTYKAATKEITVTVDPKEVAIPAADSAEFTYTGEELTYAIDENDAYTVNDNAQTNAGTYTVTVTLNDTANYVWADGTTAAKTYEFVIGKVVVAAPAADSAEFTYTGTEQTYTIASSDYYTVDGDAQTNAGTYTVTATLNDADNYVWADGTTAPKTYEFIIGKATITITAIDKTANTGDDVPEFTEEDYVVEGLVNGETLKTNPTLSYETAPDMENGGDVVINISGAEAPDGDNYDIVYNNATLTVNLVKEAQGSGMMIVLLLKKNAADDNGIAVEVVETEGGSITVDPTDAAENATVTLTPSANEGYEFDYLKVTNANGAEIALTEADGAYTFIMPASDVTVTATFKKVEDAVEADACTKDESCPLYNFVDLDLNAWYHDGVHFCVTEGLMLGTDETTFDPMLTVNRATLVTVLWRLAGSPAVDTAADFTDVEADMWYTDAIAWAAANGIVNGYGDGKFGTNDQITREQTVAILNRYASVKELATTEDVEAPADYTYSDWAKNNVAWAVENGLFAELGIDVTDLTAEASRAELATYIARFAKNIAK